MDSSGKSDLKEVLSGLVAKAMAGEKLDAGRLRDEIRKEIGSGRTIHTFLGLLESFADIIPEERQRYNAAVRALSATSGLGLQDILAASKDELEKLQLLEKEALSALPGFREELAGMESRTQEIRDEILKLREKLAEFEKKEREVLGKIAGKEKEMKAVEGAIGRIFRDIGTELTGVRDKIEEFTTGKAPDRPRPPVAAPEGLVVEEEEGPAREEEAGEEKGPEEKFAAEKTPPQESEYQKKCPMCGGQIHFIIREAKWMCYTCGYEESAEGRTAGAEAAANAVSPASESFAGDAGGPEEKVTPVAAVPEPPSRAAKAAPAGKKKVCPACGKQMEWHEAIKSWKCPACGYRRMVF